MTSKQPEYRTMRFRSFEFQLYIISPIKEHIIRNIPDYRALEAHINYVHSP